MKTSDFDYELPQELIAQTPAERRDGARMMVLDRSAGCIEHHQFTDLPDYLKPHDLLVLNNTKVVPARVRASKKPNGGAVELFFLERIQRFKRTPAPDATPSGSMECARNIIRGADDPRLCDGTLPGSGLGKIDPEKVIDHSPESPRLRDENESNLPTLKGSQQAGVEIWDVLLKSNRRPKPGQVLCIDNSGLEAVFLENLDRGRAHIEVNGPVLEMLERVGETPLPPYIHREQKKVEDKQRYQTLFAAYPGAVAAPTAGLHFSEEVLTAIRQAGASMAEVTLHVGLGTFQSVEAERLEDHVMHSERYELNDVAADAWVRTKAEQGRVLAVGSTSVRTLETVMAHEGEMKASTGRSELFIYPPYEFQAVDCMLTNFHLPCSSLIMMVSAFAGYDFTMEAYRQAVAERYRFFSYGDCMLIV